MSKNKKECLEGWGSRSVPTPQTGDCPLFAMQCRAEPNLQSKDVGNGVLPI